VFRVAFPIFIRRKYETSCFPSHNAARTILLKHGIELGWESRRLSEQPPPRRDNQTAPKDLLSPAAAFRRRRAAPLEKGSGAQPT